MKLFHCICALSVAFVISLAAEEAADRIAKLKSSYEQSLGLAAEPLQELDGRYIEELEKLKTQFQKSGNLDSALLVETEIGNFSGEADRDFRAVSGLHRLRQIYDESRSRLERATREKQTDIHHRSLKKFGDLTLEFTQEGDLESALECREIKKVIEGKLEAKNGEIQFGNGSGLDEQRIRATVDAGNFPGDPLETRVTLRNGQKFRIIPDPEGEWSGGGSKAGVFCDYKGYADRGTNWMRMYSQVGDGNPEPVDPEVVRTAAVDGDLKLFAEDGSAAGNKGAIKVEIIVDPATGG